MTERQQRLDEFGLLMAPWKGRSIALYGTGLSATDVLERWRGEFSLDMLVDDARVGETVAGMRVLSLDEALDRAPDVLAIASKVSFAESIYQRIHERCERAGVAVSDLYGNDQAVLHQRLARARAMSWDETVAAVDAHDVLCLEVSCCFPELLSTLVAEVEGVRSGETRAGRLMRRAREQGKPIVIISETPNIGVETLRDALGVELEAADLVLAHPDTGKSKDTGLYRLVREAFPGKSIVHVGRDELRDGLFALMFGVDIAPIHPRSEEEALGCPSTPPKKAALPRLALSTYEALARAVAGYVTWLVPRLLEGGFDGVIFPARDGYVLKRAYDELRAVRPDLSLPPAHYVLTSRKAASTLFADDGAAQQWLAFSFGNDTPAHMLRTLFSIDEDEDPAASCGYVENLAAIKRHCDEIERIAQETREGTMAHLASLGLHPGKRYAFCDYVSAGTCQRLLAKAMGLDLTGLYFGKRFVRGLETPDIESYFGAEHQGFMSRYVTTETLMSCSDPALARFLPDGSPVFDQDDRTPSELAAIDHAHRWILERCRRTLPSRDFGAEPISPDSIDRVFLTMQELPMEMTMTDSWRNAPNSDSNHGRRTVHDVLYGLLAAFDEVCQRHGLTYCAANGTLLGAIRHQAIIPWDNDLDVYMPREDFDRLCALPASTWEEPLFLQTAASDPGCFYGGYAKLRDSSTSAIDWRNEGHACNEGIWMDILPLDHVDKRHDRLHRQIDAVGLWQRILYAKTYPDNMELIGESSPKVRSAYFIAADLASRDWFLDRLHHACTRHEPSGVRTVLACHYRWGRRALLYAEEDLRDLERVAFGPTTIPVPRAAHAWLRRRYGKDYLTADSGDSDAHEAIRYDANTPYQELVAQGGTR